MQHSLGSAFISNFLGTSPPWYKGLVVIFLIVNPAILYLFGAFVCGWVVLAEFIFTLAMALRCYPLLPGGLLALQAIILGMTSSQSLLTELQTNFEIFLLLIFMVAGIYFMRDLLLFIFTRLLLRVKSGLWLALLFSLVSALLSAFLDALTVTAVLISTASGFYYIYHKASSVSGEDSSHHGDSIDSDRLIAEEYQQDLHDFRSFLRSLIMHSVVGTALGGVCTIVGEPQNLLIAHKMDWDFITFFYKMAPITMPVLVAGLVTCVFLERWKIFGYGVSLPPSVIKVLSEYQDKEDRQRSSAKTMAIITQGAVALLLILALAFHLASVGLIGLMVIVLLSAFNGVTEEHRIGQAFHEALPFAALLVVFFAIVAMIHDQHLFQPVTDWVFRQPLSQQPLILFVTNGVLSMISDNVFVATVYIEQLEAAFNDAIISAQHYQVLAIAVNTGTNIPSVATPNGQAAFLFLLTSALAPLIRLSYLRMLWMALPYTLVMSMVAIIAIIVTF